MGREEGEKDESRLKSAAKIPLKRAFVCVSSRSLLLLLLITIP